MKNKKFVISLVAVFVGNALVLGVWLYLFSGIKDKSLTIREIYSNLIIADKNVSNIVSLKNQIKEIENYKNTIDSVFLGERDIIDFIKMLEETAKISGVDLDFSSVREATGSAQQPGFQFSVSGTFRHVFHFIVLLENIPHQLLFEKANFSKRGKNEFGGQLWSANIDISLVSYVK